MTEVREEAYRTLINSMIEALPNSPAFISKHAEASFHIAHEKSKSPEVWAEVMKIAEEGGERAGK